MALVFTITPSIQRAVVVINRVPSSKFPLLLSRILQKLHLKDERTFSEDEEDRLQSALALSDDELQLVLETCEFFLHQAAYHAAKPTVLSQQLSKLSLDEDKVEAIVDAWQSGAKQVIEQLRQQQMLPKRLDDIHWALSLEMATKQESRLKEANACLQLTLRDDQTRSLDKVSLEMNHEELYDFYNQLETIQTQIDSLS
ncbi:hypothetical protein CAPTEDRAFT_180424 [Capitella teleta]|uniref:COMM domain-containing protein n=1 Tax=Capitella teleta TaxID=283909 RepID=R7U9R6_CAPTE|nr:hypothetical protein CAPTEDRAFT_180424 [Capitella teleta]|eukprot:ELU02871.1 hypothetical protein CAPTEDRAFT_180424 [Capitella teleta]